MASILRGIGGGKKGGDGGGGDRKRQATVDEGDEAAELAKLAVAEEEVRRLEQEIEAVQAKFNDIEAMREAWMDDPNGVFNSLKPGMRRAYKDPDGYWNFLEKERDHLSANEDALRNELGGRMHVKGGQTNIVAEGKRRRPQLWQVEGHIRGSKRLSGIRAFVYAMASDESGLAAADRSQTAATSSAVSSASSSVKPNQRDFFKDCIWYENNDLHFRILFYSAESGQRFGNKLSEHRHIVNNLFITDPVFLEKQYVTKGIKRMNYDFDDESSPASSQIISMQVTKADPKEMITRFQSIELDQLMQLGYDLEKAHLVHDAELKRRRKANEGNGDDDSNNNRIVLTSSLHKIFDGRRNGEGQTRAPLMLIEAVDDLPDTAPDVQVPGMLQEGRQKRYRVWLKVTTLDEMTMTGIIGRLKVGCFVHTVGTNGRREIYTHVHVLDPKIFKANLEWKAADTRKHCDV